MKVLRLVERMTKGVTGLDDNSNREVKSLRVLEEREVMITLEQIEKIQAGLVSGKSACIIGEKTEWEKDVEKALEVLRQVYVDTVFTKV